MTALTIALKFSILLVMGWFTIATYISLVLHRGLAHRAIAFPHWFVVSISWVCNACFLYVNPRTWVADHRMHHAFSDTEKDPDKQPQDLYWAWFFRFLRHNPTVKDPEIQKFSKDDIFQKSPSLRFLSSQTGNIASQFSSLGFAWLWFGSLMWGVIFWVALRVLALTVISFQSYFGHSSHLKFGYRNYDLNDNSANITNPIALILTAGECLQNNHHAVPRRVSHAHRETEWDVGFALARGLAKLGLISLPEVKPFEFDDSAEGLAKRPTRATHDW